jgi:hypothetical protein
VANTKTQTDRHEPADGDKPSGMFPRSWRPDQDDAHTLRGRLADISIGETMYGKYAIVVIDTGDERLAWHAMSQLAKAELVDANVQMGDDLEVNYGGKVTQQKDTGKNPYHVWSVTNHTRPKDVQGILARLGGGAASPTVATPGGDFTDDAPFN